MGTEMKFPVIRNVIFAFMKREDGPTAVEYAVMLALIIVVCVGAVSLVGENVNDTFASLGDFSGTSEPSFSNPRNLELPAAFNNGNPSGGTWRNESRGQQVSDPPDGGAIMDASGPSSFHPWARVKGSDGDQYMWTAN